MRKLRVALLTHRYFPAVGGVETYVLNLAKGLADRGLDVSVIATDLDTNDGRSRLPREEEHDGGVRVRRHWALKPLGGIPSTSFSPGMLLDALNGNFDLIHANTYLYPPTFISAVAHACRRVPTVLSSHLSTRTSAPLLRGIYNILLSRFIVRYVDHVVAFNEAEASIIRALGFSRVRVSVIPPGIDVGEFRRGGDVEGFKERYGLDGVVVSYVGRLSLRAKGLDTLVKAFRSLSTKHEDVKLMLVGPLEEGGVVQLLESPPLKSKVVATGKLLDRELVTAYQASDVVVIPSPFESFGFVLLEALAAGKPVVVTKNVGALDSLRGIQGYVEVDPGDVVGLAEFIERIIEDEGFRAKVAEEGPIVAEGFSLKRMINSILQLYREVLQDTLN